jgi:SCY1-like protein 2
LISLTAGYSQSDWKVSGLSFCSPAEGSDKPTSFQAINLSESLNLDPRLPKNVQLNLDYTSPDFVLDNTLTTSADMFSLGLLCIALYNSPHTSPLETHSSVSTYKRIFSSPSTMPSPSNKFLSSGGALPRDLITHVLPRLITRRPAQRMTAREFQESEYFDNILVSTIRFLDAFPEKTPGEKSQFLRGMVKVLPSFPKSVLEKKLLPSLLDEMKDKDLISLILQNVFKIIDLLPSAKRAFSEKLGPALKETFSVAPMSKQAQDKTPVAEKDPAKDAGLMVVLDHMGSIANNCAGKEFKDGKMPKQLST